ncbi:MAG: hypothetical protein JJ953_03330 [Gracilimonas sp.]|uniref:hypothetical protein n=1 Tax=Gracilimonas TaxID=649462 RepID=UPI001B0D2CF3|nr:hypothetical protein [Gracilimonas sp.]MBO6585118.1 hypothetical protein [Gracilimonas sp.]MBO6615610.1 hypothetical protein [Gracilimonas sp.]
MDNLPRFIFYASGILMISAAFTLISSEFLSMISNPTYVGLLVLLGFGLVYMNLVFLSGRRFMRRLQGPNPAPYVFALLVAVAPLVWVQIYDAGLGDSRLTFMFTVIVACGSGAFFGHRAGLKAQAKFQKNLKEYLNQDEKTPDDLKRSHDNLNKN